MYAVPDNTAAVDQILAEEEVDGGTADLVQWTLTDHLNTVRDIAKYDPQTGATTVVNHLVYDAFGRVTSETNPAVDSLFLFTARPFDADSGLQNNLNRWYDPAVGRWLSEDPLGFAAKDYNLYRYVMNRPTHALDPTGTAKCTLVGIVSTGPEWVRAYAGGAGVGVSPNPSPIGGEPVHVLTCVRFRVIRVKYNCVKRYGFCWLWKRRFLIIDTQIQRMGYQIDISPDYMHTTGVEIPIPKVPGVTVKLYQLDPRDQKYADAWCMSKLPPQGWPKYEPAEEIYR